MGQRKPGRHRRTVEGFGGVKIALLNLEPSFWSDLYHALLTISWWQFWLIISSGYVLVNLLFGLAYMMVAGVANARPGYFGDYFFFSVQTLGTIGYGNMYPEQTATNILVAFESLMGLFGVAMVTGLAFARFSRPTARVLFSKVAVVTQFNGVPTFMLRMANQRGNQILEAQVRVTCVRQEISPEGVEMRRFYDLALIRSETPIFFLTWLVMHPITPESPLYDLGLHRGNIPDEDVIFVVTLTGVDDTFSQTVHARYNYQIGEIIPEHHFRDVILPGRLHERVIDYTYFHQTLPDKNELNP
ncbi:ion channel [Gloeomargarita lithophora]|nr:ion channel [Gloeomargarita lithophora]